MRRACCPKWPPRNSARMATRAMVLNLSVEQETAACEQAVADIRAIVNDVFGEEAGVVGGASSVSDIREVVESDYTVVNAISIALVLLILIISFRSLLLPLILVLVIESSIWINMGHSLFPGNGFEFYRLHDRFFHPVGRYGGLRDFAGRPLSRPARAGRIPRAKRPSATRWRRSVLTSAGSSRPAAAPYILFPASAALRSWGCSSGAARR